MIHLHLERISQIAENDFYVMEQHVTHFYKLVTVEKVIGNVHKAILVTMVFC